jgi:hypothetical protein
VGESLRRRVAAGDHGHLGGVGRSVGLVELRHDQVGTIAHRLDDPGRRLTVLGVADHVAGPASHSPSGQTKSARRAPVTPTR